MIVLYSPTHHLHTPEVEYYDGMAGKYAERPERITSILDACQDLNLTIRKIRRPLTKRDLMTLHDKHYVDYFANRCKSIPEKEQIISSVFIKDTYSPIMKHTYNAARNSAGLAVTAAEMILSGEQQSIYALCRPPGHHAEHNSMMGYCYFNNAAFAADRLSWNAKKVAILDIDYHHGNGTQQLFYDRNDVLYVSLHADPKTNFPYSSGFADERGMHEGVGYTYNFPLPKDISPEVYIRTLNRAIRFIKKFQPDFFVLSLGLDTYMHDPIGNLGLVEKDYVEIGKLIAQKINLPTIIIQEGGYNVEALGNLSRNFLQGYLKYDT